MRKALFAFICIAAMALAFSGCENNGEAFTSEDTADGQEDSYAAELTIAVNGETEARFTEVADFEGATVASQTGTMFDEILNGAIKDLRHKYYDDISGQLLSLRNGDVDAVGLDEPVARLAAAQNPDLAVFGEIVQTDTYGLPMAKGGALCAQVSDVIERYTADGTLQALRDKWFSGDSEKMHIDIDAYSDYDVSAGTLEFIHDSTQTPMAYVDDDGSSAGYEVELVLMIGKELRRRVEITQANFSSLITAVTSGSADIAAGCISITDERRESVDFPTTHYEGGIVLLCRKADLNADYLSDTASDGAEGFFASVAESFYKTFVRENRWKLIVSGLLVTVLISVCSLIAGTALGFGICLLRRSKYRFISAAAAALIRFTQGVPLVVLLMVLYYLVFASLNIGGVAVAIIAFSINFAVNSAEMMRSGIDAVDVGQWEAASALGFGRVKAFRKIVMPQAIRHFLPVYKGEFINMMKMTSVVGYIAVNDLTKASDIIRSRTYEAFFPLIASALIYFLLAWLLTGLIGLIEVGIDPKKRKAGVKETTALPDNVIPTPNAVAKATGEVIRIEHLKKSYSGVTPLTDVNAVINGGEVITIIGPSGTGKSTLLRIINHLETPTEGLVFVCGNDMDSKEGRRAVVGKIGMVFQSFNLFPHLTVVENVMLAPVEILKISRREAYTSALALLKTVGLAQKALSYPDELSGGQKQRAAIARTLAMNPDIILFDEPTSALDPTMVSEVLSTIRALSQRGLTMLIVTHEMRFARDVSTRVLYMDQGVIYESGSPAEIFDNPRKENTRRFVRRLKVFEETITSEDFDFLGINTKFEEFGRKHCLSQKTINGIQVIFEELCVQTILPEIDEKLLTVLVEFSEDSREAKMYLRYKGDEFDPTANGDELSVILSRNACSNMRYKYSPENEMPNEVEVTLS